MRPNEFSQQTARAPRQAAIDPEREELELERLRALQWHAEHRDDDLWTEAERREMDAA